MGEWTQKIAAAFRNSVEFFKDAWQELRKVHWPSRKETYVTTLVVLVVVMLISIFLAVVDFGLTRAIQAIVS